MLLQYHKFNPESETTIVFLYNETFVAPVKGTFSNGAQYSFVRKSVAGIVPAVVKICSNRPFHEFEVYVSEEHEVPVNIPLQIRGAVVPTVGTHD